MGFIVHDAAPVFAAPVRRTLDPAAAPANAPQRTRDGSRRPRRPSTSVDAQQAQHAAIVALINPRGFACSGVLVHARAVLTARHCRGVERAAFGPSVSHVQAQRRVVQAIGAPNGAIDLALLVLDREAPVAPSRIRFAADPPARVRVVGFGCIDADCRSGAGSRSYFDARLRRRDWGCSREVAARIGCMPEHEMVLTRAQVADTCVGDSGGAVLARDGSGWAVVAITSRTVAGAVLPCGDGGVYVRLSAHQRWIQKELAKL